MGEPRCEALHQRLDRLRLIARRLVVGVQLEANGGFGHMRDASAARLAPRVAATGGISYYNSGAARGGHPAALQRGFQWH